MHRLHVVDRRADKWAVYQRWTIAKDCRLHRTFRGINRVFGGNLVLYYLVRNTTATHASNALDQYLLLVLE